MDGTIAIRVISLPDSARRRSRIAAEMADQPLPWGFVDGLGADGPGPPAPAAAQIDAYGRALTDSEIGCARSHLAALAAFDEEPALRWLTVIEDDVWLDPEFDLAALAARLDDLGIGYLRLFAREWRPAREVARLGERQILHVSSDPYGTQGYVIDRASADRLRRGMRQILRPIDDEMGRFWEHGLDIHMLFPFPLTERDDTSILAAARDRARAARPAPTLARRRRKLADAVAKRLYLLRRRLRN
ncbi:MAG: glycosyltransferase family 25 protein [Tranquillimonas sp.]